jgi:hypothetical protein
LSFNLLHRDGRYLRAFPLTEPQRRLQTLPTGVSILPLIAFDAGARGKRRAFALSLAQVSLAGKMLGFPAMLEFRSAAQTRPEGSRLIKGA